MVSLVCWFHTHTYIHTHTHTHTPHILTNCTMKWRSNCGSDPHGSAFTGMRLETGADFTHELKWLLPQPLCLSLSLSLSIFFCFHRCFIQPIIHILSPPPIHWGLVPHFVMLPITSAALAVAVVPQLPDRRAEWGETVALNQRATSYHNGSAVGSVEAQKRMTSDRLRCSLVEGSRANVFGFVNHRQLASLYATVVS